MKKFLLLPVFFFGMLFFAMAQPAELIVKNDGKGLHINHKVAAKEGLYSIGRLYNVSPKHIAAYNKIDLNKGLNIDQVIQIPLTDTNFTQKTKKGTPVYYTVGANEGLMAVSNANKKVSLQNLRDWNGLANDNINAGSKIVVGYLVSTAMPVTADEKPVKEIKQVVKTEPVVEKTTPVKEVVKEVVVPKKEEVKEVPKKEEVVPVVKDEPKKEVVKQAPVIKEEPVSVNTEEGYFKASYEQQVKAKPASKNISSSAGIFKTSSGWQDAKYYLLIDGVPSGSIIKLTNPDNNRTVYAKVLGEMNGIRQNQGLDVRISNAAATALGFLNTEKFTVKLSY